jgi:SAM-dependent methyltransferase
MEPNAPPVRNSPAAERNKDAILNVLKRVFPERGNVLEIASGTGQHVMHFARALRNLQWHPSDPDGAMCASIEARLAQEPLTNVSTPLQFDVLEFEPGMQSFDAVLCINMIHIAPWPAATGLFATAMNLLLPGAPLVLYGPYRRGGMHTAPSNVTFDASLKARNPAWGVRDIEAVSELAIDAGFVREEVLEMPANNLLLVFRRR